MFDPRLISDLIDPVPEGIMRPLWSVMIPTYNPDDYLYDTLKCVTAQYIDDEQMEIVVVDDKSTKVDVAEMIRKFGNDKVRLFVQPQNVGHSFNFTECIRQSKGKLIHILHCDDIVYREFYNTFQNDFDQFPEAGAVYCRQAYIDEKSEIKFFSESDLPNTGVIENAAVHLAERQRIQYCGMAVRRSVYESVGGFIKKNIGCEDWEMWVRIASRFPVVYEPRALAGYRVHHGTSMTLKDMRTGQDMRFLRESAEIFNEYLPEELQREVKTTRQKYYGKFSLKNAKMLIEEHDDVEGAAAQLTETIQLDPELVLSESSFLEQFSVPVPGTGVSVIVSTLNSEDTIERTLRHLIIQRVPAYIPWEVIISDAGSADRTIEIAKQTWKKYGGKVSLKILRSDEQNLRKAADEAVSVAGHEFILFCNPGEYLIRDYIKRASLNMLNDIELAGMSGYCEIIPPKDPPKWFDKHKETFYQSGELADHTSDITWSKGYVWLAGLVMRRSAYTALKKSGYMPFNSSIPAQYPSDVFNKEFFYALRALGWRFWYIVDLIVRKQIPGKKLNWEYHMRCAGLSALEDLNLKRFESLPKNKRLRSLDGFRSRISVRKEVRNRLRNIRRIPLWKKKIYPEYVGGDEHFLTIHSSLSVLNELLPRIKDYNKRVRLLRRYSSKSDLRFIPQVSGDFFFRYPSYKKPNDFRGVTVALNYSGSSPAYLKQCLEFISKQKTQSGLPWEVLVLSTGLDKDTDTKLKLLNFWERTNCPARLRILDTNAAGNVERANLILDNMKFDSCIILNELSLISEDFVRVSNRLIRVHDGTGMFAGSSRPALPVKAPAWFGKYRHLFESYDSPGEPLALSYPERFIKHNPVLLRKSALEFLCKRLKAIEISDAGEKCTDMSGMLSEELTSWGSLIKYVPRLHSERFFPPDQIQWRRVREISFANGYQEHVEQAGSGFAVRAGSINKELSLLFQKPFRKILSSRNEYKNDKEVIEIESSLGRLKRLASSNGKPSPAGISGNGSSAVLHADRSGLAQKGEAKKGVSVVICCYNSSKIITRTLRTILDQEVHSDINWEIILVDNASTDDTSAKAEQCYRQSSCSVPFRIVHEYEPGLSNARSKGIGASRYEYVIFCDDDNRLEKDFVARVYSRMESDEFIGVLGGQSRAQFESEPPHWFNDWKDSFAIGRQHTKSGNITYSKGYVWGASMAVRKSAWKSAAERGFRNLLSDRKGNLLSSGGDTEICYSIRNAGYKIYYDPALKFAHYIPLARMNWEYVERLFFGFGAASYGLDTYRRKFNESHEDIIAEKIHSRKYELRKAFRVLQRKNYRKLLKGEKRIEGMSDVPMVEYLLGRIRSVATFRLNPASSTHLLKRSLGRYSQTMLAGSISKYLKHFPAYPKSAFLNGVSVVICTFNGESRLPQTLSYIAKQKTDPNLLWEVILVDNASTDNTKQASIDEWSKHKCTAELRIVDEPTPGLSSARHKGFKTARYNYIILCDDDNWLDEDFVQLTYDIMSKDKSIGILGGPNKAQFDEKPPEWFKWFQHGFATGEQWDFKTNRLSEGDITWKRGFVWGAGMILRKKAVDDLYAKGFTSLMQDRKGYQLSSGGDSELCYALVLSGWKVCYDKRLTCYHMMPSGRITWNYLIRLFQGFGITSVGLDPYEKAIQLGRADIIDKVILAQDWKYEFMKSLNELRKAGIRNVLRIRLPQDNNTKVPMIEYHLFRLQELWRVRKEYNKNLKAVRESVWRIDNKILRKKHRDFAERENDFRYGWPWSVPAHDSGARGHSAEKLPKISILSPSFNSENTIEKAIVSVLNQNYPNFEHIICDGGSKDRTVEIIKKYPHVRWVSEPDNGQCDAMNKAFSMATGDVVAYLNVDDYFQRDAFFKVAKAFIENPEADMVVGNLFFDENGNVFLRNPEIEYAKILQPYKYIFPINPVCYFYKRKVQEAAGPFPLDNHYTMDYWFLLKAFQNSKIVKIDSQLGTFWMNGFNKTSAADNRKNVHKTALQHLWANDRNTLPFYLFNYYKHYYYDIKPYNLKKIRYKARKNLSRIYSIVTLKKNKYYSNRLYDEARSSYYLDRKAKAFATILLSFIIYPKGLKQRSKQSLAVQSVFSSGNFTKLKFLYVFFTTPPGVPLGNKLDYFGRKKFEEGLKAKGRALFILSYLTSPKFLLDENYIYDPLRNKLFGKGPLWFVNPLNWARGIYSFVKYKKHRDAAFRFYERSGQYYKSEKRYRAFASMLICMLIQPSSAVDSERRNLLLYSLFGEKNMDRWHTINGIYKENPEIPFAHKLNYYGNQQRRDGNGGYGNAVLLLAYLISPKYILKREKISKQNIVVSSQKVDFKVKAGDGKAAGIKPGFISTKSLEMKKEEVKTEFSNSLEMARYRLQQSYDFFRYRKFKAKSKFLYADAQDFYYAGKKSKVPGPLISSFLLYPPSLLSRNKWSLLLNSVLSDSTLTKIKRSVKGRKP